ncbi:MAG: UDP-N-acetyl-D-glucosamine 2-epimerase, UDP-hydrolysing [Bacteroidetes bacterium GWF2_43_63]|nr:MAG: UDP-N-acetyl-D-glucosamine 2-epimerase, UDP-hydrolysing [Bacteroidetes bacterium GWE2_42_42]OFY56049.1 MAG: UDP-N-acetyl-D-glucosamine 2-epimerase, UDP-hydrolysing [Bacteroidetes bacterium GWF2_43_63]HBG70703.1 UDP-N-acetylglucosamine 2-epimerase (hydrolyzing) [Bacteroidales bacterium]HCB62469.1 UDP-N-acetylglucosamine 2-epimerase (hydrolyzing) [Bacteroidales bacterium]HCY21924.1 UDP-N-acetylglucosamine 2-epimerase (hydrolyzing) [Bacteroidales bacterium]
MKRICIVTGTRAEYGLLYWLIKEVHEDPALELQLLVTGMHMSPEFGLTWKQIEKDGFPISKKMEILLSSDTAVGISKSNSLALLSFAETFEELAPEIVVLLGDRTEIFAAAQAALIAGIPVAHIHGGELTEGAYDDAIRHSITKMSHLHFTATDEYRKRVIQLGEQPATVFNVGAMGLDNIKRLNLLDQSAFEESIEKKLLERNLLITFHPVTLEKQTAHEQFQQLLDALNELDNTLLIFTKPNSDKDGRIIIQMIDEFVSKNPHKAIAFTSLGQLRYLSAIPFMNAVVGNSSSGIIEVPSFNVPTINIGDRQKGRIMGRSVISCKPSKNEISKALEKAFEFDKTLPVSNPFGEGNAAEKILNILKKTNKIELKKQFYNIDFQLRENNA